MPTALQRAEAWSSGLDDLGFLRGDLRYCVAEYVCMLKLDRCQDRCLAHDDVGRIKPSAESCLYHSPLASDPLEEEEGECGVKFECGGAALSHAVHEMKALKGICEDVSRLDKDAVFHKAPASGETLPVVGDMW